MWSLLLSILCVRQVGQARALYNFGNVYHAKGKSVSCNDSEPGKFPKEVTAALKKAAEYYELVCFVCFKILLMLISISDKFLYLWDFWFVGTFWMLEGRSLPIDWFSTTIIFHGCIHCHYTVWGWPLEVK